MREPVVESKACIVCRIVKSRMKWTGHMVRVKDKRLSKRSETRKLHRNPLLRWEDSVNRYPRKAEEEEK